MFEIFCIGKLDVFSSKDAGLRLAMEKSLMIKPNSDWRKYDKFAKKWSPFRTICTTSFFEND